MNETKPPMTIQIKYKEIEKTVSGNPEEIWLLLNKFFEEMLPAFEIARKLSLETDLQTLANESKGLIGFSNEGPYLLIPKDKLTDNETLVLLLLANHLEWRLRKTQTDGLSKDELQTKLGKNAKITSTRLGELVKSEIAMKTRKDAYRLTTYGLVQLQKDIIPRIRSKTAF